MVLLRTTTVALLGNPNTGKTTLFNALSGLRQRVGNYPGVTVETKKGQFTFKDQSLDLIDLPGTYSLAPRSPDEMVAVDLMLGHQAGEPRPDVVVSIVDASNLERNLYLTTQALELGVPVVVALNMIDLAEGQGLRIDVDRLQRQLGIPVVPIQANKGKGLDELKQAIVASLESGTRNAELSPQPARPRGVPFPEAFEREVEQVASLLGPDVPPFLVRRLLLDVGGYTEKSFTARGSTADIGKLQAAMTEARQRLAAAGCPVPAVEARSRYGWIREATVGCVQRPAQRPVTWTDRIDRVLTHKVWGTLFFLVLMFVVFQALFTWAAPLMDLIKEGFASLGDAIKSSEVLPPGPLRSLLADGIVAGVGGVLVFLPQILILFAFIAILEDCGYMARAAFLMDKVMAKAGLSGKSFIPMLSSVACAVPGIMATRVIENRRDRLATILVAPLMSCSARLPVYTLLIAAFLSEGFPVWLPGLVMFSMYLLGLVIAPLVAFVLRKTLLRGEKPVFVMEMPLYKLPSARTVLRRMSDSGWAFVRRAGTIILASMVVIWALLYFPRTNSDGATYEEKIAQQRASIASQQKELDELKESIAPQQKELDEIEEQLKNPGRWFDLFAAGSPAEKRKAALEERKQQLETEIEPVRNQMKPLEEQVAPVEDAINELNGEWKRRSWLGQMGHAIAPVVRPLGWDWKIGMAALASFPAREVVVGTLSIIYNLGEGEATKDALQKALADAEWQDDPERAGQKVFTVPVALSLMVFFALCCQCASTLAVIRRETRSWFWPAFTFVYMTGLAYVGALVVYQVGRLMV